MPTTEPEVTDDYIYCPACAFRYGAEHTNADGTYSCPLCEMAEAQDAIGRLRVEYDKLRRENAEVNEGWRLEIQMREAAAYAVARTVGGTVEGLPTTQHNYLQRLRELVQLENENAELRERLETAEREETGEKYPRAGEQL